MTNPAERDTSTIPTDFSGWGLIAGNGRFPFLVLEAARSQGIDMAVLALREEASPELERLAKRIHWVSLGDLSRAIELLHKEGVKRAVMAGQVKHKQIFSSIRPDWRLAKLIFSLPFKNTDSLIGAVAGVLKSEGIELVDSTAFLKPLVPEAGVLTRRAPDAREAADMAYGRTIARAIAALDLGQTVVVRDGACVAIEAMEGTDETIQRAARIVLGAAPDGASSAAIDSASGTASGSALVVVKVSKPRQDMRFDVPVIGLETVEVMRVCGVTALAIDAGRTLLFDRAHLIAAADAAGISIEAFATEASGESAANGPRAAQPPSEAK
jgi:UDP-2,3-diacylglucosamine hydrolase